LRKLIDENLIPDDVTIQVLTQAREHIIKKTFEALKGAKNVIVHVYNSTSVAQREQVFKKDKEEVKQIAIEGATLLKDLTEKYKANYRFEYSPESFTGTEPEYALEVVNAVLDVWQPTPDKKAIINLPATVENAMPHVYAQQVEFMNKNIKYRNSVVVSLHPHNDRGCGVAAAEFGLLAGADRIEGTLFGNGERTGNVDIITVAMNMYSQGVDPKLNFDNMPYITAMYKRFTGMEVNPRQPYAGELVFAAFSGSHQDAIAKGMTYRKKNKLTEWNVPYIPIDPKDIGREYESDVIRINSQSGKGGIGYIMQTSFGIDLPRRMKEDMGYKVKHVSDVEHKELKAVEIYEIFESNYLTIRTKFDIPECHFSQEKEGISALVSIDYGTDLAVVEAEGNGRLDAVSNAIKMLFGLDYTLTGYEQHALTDSSSAKAISYVGVESEDKIYWGAGIDDDIIKSSYKALISAVNNLMIDKHIPDWDEE
jgi:2-isopropylmalate synthase